MTSILKDQKLEKAQEMKSILKNILEQGERLQELSAAVPPIKNSISQSTQDIAELSIDLIYIICDYIGSAPKGTDPSSY